MEDKLHRQLKALQPSCQFFIGIDSDGCVFDTMDIKHKQCFAPKMVEHFKLQEIEELVIETWAQVTLYSPQRGVNRYFGFADTVKRLLKHPYVQKKGFQLPDISTLEDWLKQENMVSNPSLEKYLRNHENPALRAIYNWSLSADELVKESVKVMPPYKGAKEAIEKMHKLADTMVISQSPVEAIKKEWTQNRMNHLVSFFAGQQYGAKTDIIKNAAIGKYANQKILMMGDAPGDLKAALNNDVLFYPIIPGKEAESWERFATEALSKFIDGRYTLAYQNELIEDFNDVLNQSKIN